MRPAQDLEREREREREAEREQEREADPARVSSPSRALLDCGASSAAAGRGEWDPERDFLLFVLILVSGEGEREPERLREGAPRRPRPCFDLEGGNTENGTDSVQDRN